MQKSRAPYFFVPTFMGFYFMASPVSTRYKTFYVPNVFQHKMTSWRETLVRQSRKQHAAVRRTHDKVCTMSTRSYRSNKRSL